MFEQHNPVNEGLTDCFRGKSAWYAVRVRARSEQLVASLLVTRQVECFAPSWQECRTYSDRLKHVPVAVFPGYIFCRIDPPRRLQVCNTPGVQYLVGAMRNPEAIEEYVIAGLQKAFSETHRVSQVPYLRAGDLVQVVDGPLTGTVGTLLRLKGHLRLVLSVDVLQRSVAVEVDGASVVPLSRHGERSNPPWFASPMNHVL